jgi:1-acyl-sn-glycerol-3-phosphate acyltransferase
LTISRFLPTWAIGSITVILMSACIGIWFVVMLPFVLVRLTPIYKVQRFASGICVQIATLWVGSNRIIYRLMHGKQGQVRFEGKLSPKQSYLVLSNHQAWADIQILFDELHGHAPFGRFFLKQELIWVPIVGIVCWAMDFPFMKRHSREKLTRNPQLAQQDLETTRKACEIYKQQPVSVINFLEGTRFNPKKHQKSKSRYTNLMNPKFGGLSASLNAMGEQFEAVVDFTIVYEPTHKNLTWSWLCGEQQKMQIHIKVLPIPEAMITGNYRDDPKFKSEFKTWVSKIWADKDIQISELKNNIKTSI